MSKSLLVVGAGIYSQVVYEIALEMDIYTDIDFVDDMCETAPSGKHVIGTVSDLCKYENNYCDVFVAIGNCEKRLAILNKIKTTTSYNIATLISPKAYVAPSAQIFEGCCVEPMAVIQSNCLVEMGCFISAGAVINHACRCEQGVHVDCNATLPGYLVVPYGTKINYGEIYKGKEYV